MDGLTTYSVRDIEGKACQSTSPIPPAFQVTHRCFKYWIRRCVMSKSRRVWSNNCLRQQKLETRWEILFAHKLEFFSLKWAITEKVYDYLYGTRFEAATDNNPLTYILTSAKLDATGQRWFAALSSYNFDLTYWCGMKIAAADEMSRLPRPDNMETNADNSETNSDNVAVDMVRIKTDGDKPRTDTDNNRTDRDRTRTDRHGSHEDRQG